MRYLQSWIDQLRWQRLPPLQRLAQMLADHLDGILNYCRTKVSFGVVEAINGNIKTLLRRGRGYKKLAYLLLKVQRMAVTKQNLSFFRKRLKMQDPSNSFAEPFFAGDDFFGEGDEQVSAFRRKSTGARGHVR